jgi:CPA2 family monovalent cation:H+ antiporter-2
MLASHALALVGVPVRRVIRVVQEQRDARYGLLRGYFHGADDDTTDDLQQVRLLTVSLPSSGSVLGKTLADLSLQAGGVTVVSVRQAGGTVTTPADNLTLRTGDTLVLSGLPEALSIAEGRLLSTP